MNKINKCIYREIERERERERGREREREKESGRIGQNSSKEF